MIGTMNGKIVYVPFAKAVKHDKGIDRPLEPRTWSKTATLHARRQKQTNSTKTRT